MITDLFFGLIDMFLSLIPDISFSLELTGGIGAVGQLFAYVDNFVPVSVILSCISIVLLVDNIGFFVKIFNFIIRKIPGIS